MDAEHYPTTQWTLVLQAADANDPARAREALERLCAKYSPAIHEYMRAHFRNRHDAEDTAQDFLCRWLKQQKLVFVRGDGPFRNWLSVCLKNFLRDRPKPPPEEPPPTELAEAEPPPSLPESALLDRALAHQIARDALVRLRESWLAGSRAAAFLAVARIAILGGDTPYAELARRHGCQINTVKGWVHTMRREYGQLFRAETARITTPAEVAEEWRHLMELAPYLPDGRSFYATLTEIFR